MTEQQVPEQHDARRAYRVQAVRVGAACRWRRFKAQYKVENLSTAGALLKATRVPPVGEAITVQLTLPNNKTLEVTGHVVRHLPSPEDEARPGRPTGGPALAVQFDGLSQEASDAIHDAVVDIILRDWEPADQPQPPLEDPQHQPR